ncbi:hypothetical protein ACFWCB_03060 [Streptomyces sp. NPDC060048]|uniref:hypothetical protein n=1 Tax=unclassified Streptomyces TaxID=2593676 RepID=UPI0036BBB881
MVLFRPARHIGPGAEPPATRLLLPTHACPYGLCPKGDATAGPEGPDPDDTPTGQRDEEPSDPSSPSPSPSPSLDLDLDLDFDLDFDLDLDLDLDLDRNGPAPTGGPPAAPRRYPFARHTPGD